MTRTSLAPLLFLLAAVAACTVGPSYRGPPAVAPVAVARGAFVRGGDPSITPAPGLARWWETLSDPTLTGLIDDALAHNPSIDLAEARIREARASLRQQQAALLPSANASASYLHAQVPTSTIGSVIPGAGAATGGSLSFDSYNLGGIASWEPDLWGGGRRGVEQARANVGEQFADLADSQVSLTAQVAQAYVNLRGAQEQIRLNAHSIELQRQVLELTQQRFEGGTATELDVDRLRSQLESTEAQVAPLGAQADSYLDALAILTGREPGALDEALSGVVPTPLPPPTVAVGDPAALVAHRPDIRSAERALAASTAGIGVSEAKLFPSVRFLGFLGMGGSKPSDVLNGADLTTLLAPSLSWNILDFGKARAAVRESEAQRDEAQAQYRQAVLGALQDAETSLSSFGHQRRQLGDLARAASSASRAAELNRIRVVAGTSSVIDQLNIEGQRLSAEIALSQGKTALTNSYIAVQKSLGLGWTEPSQAADARADGRPTPGA